MTTATCTYRILLNQLLHAPEDKLPSLQERLRQLITKPQSGADRIEITKPDADRVTQAKDQGKIPKELWNLCVLRSFSPQDIALWISTTRPTPQEVIQACSGTWNGALMPFYLTEGEADYVTLPVINALIANVVSPPSALEDLQQAFTSWLGRNHQTSDPAVWGAYYRAWPELMKQAGLAFKNVLGMRLYFLITLCNLQYRNKDRQSQYAAELQRLFSTEQPPNDRVPPRAMAEIMVMGMQSGIANPLAEWHKFWNYPEAIDGKWAKAVTVTVPPMEHQLVIRRNFVQYQAVEPKAQVLRLGPDSCLFIAECDTDPNELIALWEWVLANKLYTRLLYTEPQARSIVVEQGKKWNGYAKNDDDVSRACTCVLTFLLMPKVGDDIDQMTRHIRIVAEAFMLADVEIQKTLTPILHGALTFLNFELAWAVSMGASTEAAQMFRGALDALKCVLTSTKADCE
jgi:hypothetical protein